MSSVPITVLVGSRVRIIVSLTHLLVVEQTYYFINAVISFVANYLSMYQVHVYRDSCNSPTLVSTVYNLFMDYYYRGAKQHGRYDLSRAISLLSLA